MSVGGQTEVSAFIDRRRAAGFAVELTCRSIGTSATEALIMRVERSLNAEQTVAELEALPAAARPHTCAATTAPS
jgi:hypothetical protein